MISTWASTGGPSKSKKRLRNVSIHAAVDTSSLQVTVDIVNNLDQQFQDLPAGSLCGLRFTYEHPKTFLKVSLTPLSEPL